jgi:hypothetical protein
MMSITSVYHKCWQLLLPRRCRVLGDVLLYPSSCLSSIASWCCTRPASPATPVEGLQQMGAPDSGRLMPALIDYHSARLRLHHSGIHQLQHAKVQGPTTCSNHDACLACTQLSQPGCVVGLNSRLPLAALCQSTKLQRSASGEPGCQRITATGVSFARVLHRLRSLCQSLRYKRRERSSPWQEHGQAGAVLPDASPAAPLEDPAAGAVAENVSICIHPFCGDSPEGTICGPCHP